MPFFLIMFTLICCLEVMMTCVCTIRNQTQQPTNQASNNPMEEEEEERVA
jgi:hypothetical protein